MRTSILLGRHLTFSYATKWFEKSPHTSTTTLLSWRQSAGQPQTRMTLLSLLLLFALSWSVCVVYVSHKPKYTWLLIAENWNLKFQSSKTKKYQLFFSLITEKIVWFCVEFTWRGTRKAALRHLIQWTDNNGRVAFSLSKRRCDDRVRSSLWLRCLRTVANPVTNLAKTDFI